VSTNDEPFVSVVTPFYNTAEYLAECIESVLAQSHSNFEYILVDNQSNDGSTEIAGHFAGRDGRIRYVRTPRFFTQIENYNFTLEQSSARSRYVKMVQADDWIFPQCLSEMVAAGVRHPSAAIVSSYLLTQEGQLWGVGLPPGINPTFLSGRETARLHLQTPIFLFGSPTTVMYRADVVREHKPFFEDGRYHPDTETNYKLLRDHDFVFVHQVLSFMRQQPGSITYRARNMNPDALDRMIVTKLFGPVFLSAEEYSACWEQASAWFYSELGKHWLRAGLPVRKTGFWERQRKGLGDVDESIEFTRFANGLSSALLKTVASPVIKALRIRKHLAESG
jgi:glycosyltransferase involved in cell wall biosynthesis